MINTEKVKKVIDITFNKVNDALKRTNGDVDAAIQLLPKENQVDSAAMNNRIANNAIVYSYVHNGKIGAMIVLACQTDFVAKNEKFLELAKDICMHIVSTSTVEYISGDDISAETLTKWTKEFSLGLESKPKEIREKIVFGKIKKQYEQCCLLNQKFVKNEEITIGQLISSVSAIVGEKIELKKFVRITNVV